MTQAASRREHLEEMRRLTKEEISRRIREGVKAIIEQVLVQPRRG
jgi:hypothetical protein